MIDRRGRDTNVARRRAGAVLAAATAVALLALSPAASAQRLWEIQPDAVDFGDVIVESPGRTLPVEIANETDDLLLLYDLLITATVPFSTGATAVFQIVADRCSDELLAPGEKCTVDVRFRPRSVSTWSVRPNGFPNAISNLRYTTFDGLFEAFGSRQLVGNALTPAGLSVWQTEWAFPGVRVGRTGTPRPIHVVNAGTASLQVGEPALEGADAGSFAVSRNECAEGPIRSCTVWVTFEPTRTGPQRATLALRGTPSGSAHVQLEGTGKPGFEVAVRRRTRLAARRLAGRGFVKALDDPASAYLGWHRWPVRGTVRARLVLVQRGGRRVLARNRRHRVDPSTWRPLDLPWVRGARRALTRAPKRARMVLAISLEERDGTRLTARRPLRARTR